MSRREAKQRRMFRLVRRWEESGESARSFVKRCGMREGKLWYWVRQHRSRGMAERATPALLPVEIRERIVGSEERIEIELAEGLVVRVREEVPPEIVGRLIVVLRRPC